MIPIFLLILVSAPTQINLLDETVSLQRQEVRAVNLSLLRDRAVIDVSYTVLSGPTDVEVNLIGPGDGTRAAPGTPDQYLRMMSGQPSGQFRFPARQLGEYQVTLDARNAADDMEVRLTVNLIFDELGTAQPARLSPRRRGSVVAASLVFFLAVCWWSSRKLIVALRRRPRAGPPSVYW